MNCPKCKSNNVEIINITRVDGTKSPLNGKHLCKDCTNLFDEGEVPEIKENDLKTMLRERWGINI